MEKKTVDVIIPAYRPGEGWKQMLRGLEGQTWPVHRLIVMNTGKENWKAAYEKTTIPMEVHHLTREEFDHGKTRDQAARMSRADYLLFMTQDALPEDCHLIEKLVEAMERDEKIGAAYARQLPREDCRLMEQYTRQFNYPEESRVKWLADLPEHWDFGELTPGAQVRVRRSGYYHHGIYIGNGEIVHFDGSPNEQDAAAVRVRRTGMEEFLRGGLPELRIYGRAERKLLRAPDEIAAAALSAVGRSGYDYRTNNCEHFSNECAFGEHYSRQSGEGNE